MKKKYLIIMSCLLLTIVLFGCTETPAHISVSRSLDKNLNNLSYTVSKLDTIDNKTIANPDMYGTMQTFATPSNNSSTKITLMSFNPQEQVSNYLFNKMISNYTCDSNGNCYLCNNSFGDGRNSTCSSCDGKIICDKFGNCTSCKNQLNLTNDGTCLNCNFKCIDGTCGDTTVNRFNTDFPILNSNNNMGTMNNNNQNNCGSNYRNPLETNQISATSEDINAEVLNENLENDEYGYNQNLEMMGNEGADIEDENNEENEPSYAEKFKDQFTSNYDKLETRNNQSFRNPMRRNQRDFERSTIDNLDYLSTENEDNFSGQNEEEIVNFNEQSSAPKTLYYYYEENFTPDSLRYNPRFVTSYDESTTSNQLNNYVVKVQKLYAITSDVLEANNELASYRTTLLDRIAETKNLNNEFKTLTFEPNFYQVQAMRNYLGDLKATNSSLRAVNGTINDQINNISNNNPTITSSIDIMNSNYLKLLNQLDIRITYHKNALATLEQLTNVLEDAMINQTPNNYDNNIQDDTVLENPVDNNTDVANDTLIEDNQNVDDLDNNQNITDTNIDSNENNIGDDGLIVENNEKFEENSANETTNNSVIDTYADNSLKNIDTYKNNENDFIENNLDNNSNNIVDENSNLKNSENNSLITNNDIFNNENLNNDIIDDNTNNNLNNNLDFDENLNNNVDNNIDNNINTELDNEINNNRNGIINQNNLNTDGNIDNGSNYVYDENGKLYNANNNNLINNTNTNNNVDTYSYNTLIDTINRGTVDNGINTLNISAVNSNADDLNSNLQTLEYIEPVTEENLNEENEIEKDIESLNDNSDKTEEDNETIENNETENNIEKTLRDAGGIRKSIATCEDGNCDTTIDCEDSNCSTNINCENGNCSPISVCKNGECETTTICEEGECKTIENGDNMEQESNELNEKQPSTLEEPSVEFISDENI